MARHGLGATAWKVCRVGFLWDSPTVTPDDLVAFREGLRDLGWIEGQNVDIEFRWAEGRFERLPELANELVRLNVDVIVAPTSIYAEAAKRATAIIPIVFVGHADPLGSGHVASLASPGGNLTGTSLMMTDTNAKGLQLMKRPFLASHTSRSSMTQPHRRTCLGWRGFRALAASLASESSP